MVVHSVVRKNDDRIYRGVASALARLLITSLLILMATRAPRVQAQGTSHNVLLLNSYHHGLGWTDGIVEAVRSQLLDPTSNPIAGTTGLYIEYMDTKRMGYDEATEQRWREFLAEKYRSISLDLIIVSDNNAYDFLRAHRDRLFPGVPVIFCGVNFFQNEEIAGLEAFTGVIEEVDPRSTIDVALDLHPGTRRIYVVNDGTPTGQQVQKELEAVLPFFEGRVEFTMILDPSVEDLQQLKGLPDDTLVLLMILNRDSEGNFYTYEQGMDLLFDVTDRPIYGVWDFYLGWGLVGGMLTNAGLQGEAAAEMALQVLNGADVQHLPVLEQSPNRYMFDYEQLQRFDIPIGDVPDSTASIGGARTVIINRPISFLERYGLTLGGILVVGVVALGIVLFQRNSLLKQQAIESTLRRTNEELDEARSSMEDQVDARTRDLQERSRQLQIASAVAREAVGIRDLDDLMTRVADLVSDSFGFYHTGIFLIDELRERAVLRAASSEGGRMMIERGHSLRVGQEGIVGAVARTGEARIALDVADDYMWVDTHELSKTRSEMALPLMVQNRVIGVLDVQSEAAGAFGREDMEVLGIVADQLGLAIQNARLFEESQEAISRLETAYSERMDAIWARAEGRAYTYDGFEVQPAESGLRGPDSGEDNGRLIVPIVLRGLEIGSIVLRRDADTVPWSEEERTLAEAVGIQAGLSLENAQLLSESRTRAQRERALADISSRMRETLDMDLILQTALREIGENLGVSSIEVRMEPGDGA
jgi:GAF domain-containing protein